MSRIVKYSGILVGGIAVGAGVGLYTGNDLLFSPSLKLVCWGASLASNTNITFDEAYGSIRSGRIQLKDAKVVRKQRSKDIDLDIRNLELLYNKSFFGLWNDFRSKNIELIFNKIEVRGVKGTITIKSESDPLPDFSIKTLQLENIQLQINDHRKNNKRKTEFQFPPLAVYRMTGNNLRSKTMLRDVLVSSSLLGTLGTGVIEVSRGGNKIDFNMKNIPVGIIGEYLGEPFSWFDEAVIDAKANDEYEELLHNIKFNILLRELVPHSSSDLSRTAKLITPILAKYITKHESRIPLIFELKLHEEEVTTSNITKQLTTQLAAKVYENWTNIGKGWEDLKKMVNDTLQH